MNLLTILHLYPREMDAQGDNGNVLVLRRRAEWRGVKVTVVEQGIGDVMPEKCDLIVGGGGQDAGQRLVVADLRKNGEVLKKWVEDGVPALVVGGMYQLFGNFIRMADGDTIEGISVLDMETEVGGRRVVGNVMVRTGKFGEVVGYENHTGVVRLGEGLKLLGEAGKGARSGLWGEARRGVGDHGSGGGVLYKNMIGTYLHGPVLPRNPRMADFLIRVALERKYGAPQELIRLDDRWEIKARRVATELAR